MTQPYTASDYLYPMLPMRSTLERLIALEGSHEWLVELKRNGLRCLCWKDSEARLFLLTRHRTVITDVQEEWVNLLDLSLPPLSLLDGEILGYHREKGKHHHPTYYVFDLIKYQGINLSRTTFWSRRQNLERLCPAHKDIHLAPQYHLGFVSLYKQAISMGEEGVVAKKLDSPYQASPHKSIDTPYWLKIKP